MKTAHCRFLLLIFAVAIALSATAQGERRQQFQRRVYDGPSWFVDGFHGGIYGHYPKPWYTGFLCDQLDQHPAWSLSLEIEPETWDTIAVIAPNDLARLRAYSETERVEFTNPSYAQPYLWNIDGESIIRQFLYGMRTTLRHFPDVTFSTYAVEEPCFTSCLPAVLSGLGFRYAVLRCPNTCWGGYPASHGTELVNMIGPDGTRLLAVPRPECEDLQPRSVWQTTSWGNHTYYLEACKKAGIEHPVGMTYQDAGWKNGPWIGYGDNTRNHSTYTTWRRYIETVTDGTTADDWHFSQEDIRPNLMWGSTVMNELAAEVRHAESTVEQAEKVSALSTLAARCGIADGYNPDTARIDEAWRTLFLSQHHDSWIVPYNGLLRRGMNWAKWIKVWTSTTCNNASDEVDEALAAVTEPADGTFTLFNTSADDRRETVSVAGITFPAEVPAFGWKSYTLDEARTLAAKAAVCSVKSQTHHELVVTNGCYEVHFSLDKGGSIEHLIARQLGDRDIAATQSIEGVTPADKFPATFGTFGGYFYDTESWHSSAENAVRATISGDGTPLLTVTLDGRIAGSPFTQTYTFKADEPLIDCNLFIDWKKNMGIGEYRQKAEDIQKPRRAFGDERYKLCLYFPTTLTEPQLSKDAAFDVCESKQDSTWFGSWRDIQHDVILHWVDLSEADGGDGLALLTDHTGAYSYGPGFPLSLTAQYSGVGLWGRNYALTAPLNMHYALLPHHGGYAAGEVEHASRCWNEPLVVSQNAQPRHDRQASLLTIGGNGYEISSFRPLDGGWELRLYNANGDDAPHTVTLPFTGADVKETDLRGEVLQPTPTQSGNGTTTFSVAMPRYAFRTFYIR